MAFGKCFVLPVIQVTSGGMLLVCICLFQNELPETTQCIYLVQNELTRHQGTREKDFDVSWPTFDASKPTPVNDQNYPIRGPSTLERLNSPISEAILISLIG